MEIVLTTGAHARSFEQTTSPHLDAAYNLARWLTRDPHDAEDVVQEAYLRAYKFFHSFRGDDSRAWLLTIVRNTGYTWLQQNRRQSSDLAYDETLHDAASEQTAEHQVDPETLLLRDCAQQQVGQALESLPLEFREVLVLRELEELSYQQIAQIAAIPLGTVMSRLSRARKLLKAGIQRLSQE